MPDEFIPLDGDSPAERALAEIAEFAAGRPEFAAVWESSLRRAADTVAATLAGARMRGAGEPSAESVVLVELGDTVLPCPHEMDPELACSALMLAAFREAERRLEKSGPGGPG